jgi:hypothetical protein
VPEPGTLEQLVLGLCVPSGRCEDAPPARQPAGRAARLDVGRVFARAATLPSKTATGARILPTQGVHRFVPSRFAGVELCCVACGASRSAGVELQLLGCRLSSEAMNGVFVPPNV